ncbi:hypothetical protein T440DRAFT_471011 [Plenodomus tracheiphilus IPT5]|uniref:DUF985 domain-containing protein n=1 Tax=Plenodomus tracheiphilus IPT5 TaxID=1408161 RepID=A0A6A7AWM9_9PLEO|nr:hypothetical protein T440DRAFT_471011 [Plenodomus tracheiphilus IPT5]
MLIPIHSLYYTTAIMSSSSSIPGISEKLKPLYTPSLTKPESNSTQAIIDTLHMIPNIEGGLFVEIDRNPLIIPNPFLLFDPNNPHNTTLPSSSGIEVLPSVSAAVTTIAATTTPTTNATAPLPQSGNNNIRNASTSIFYLLTPRNPQGHFHRNKGRTVHTVIEGRGRYVLIHADEDNLAGGVKRMETFIVGKDVAAGEKAVWVVEGGKYKASFLLGEGGDAEGDRLLISETVIPGFEYSDHDFLSLEKFKTLVTEEQAKELEWLVRRE